MGYTPAFRSILDGLEALQKEGKGLEVIRGYFKDKVSALPIVERLNNLYRIRPKRPSPGETSRAAPFTMNRMQAKYMGEKTNRDLILKMRQGGVTTLSCLIALDKSLWETGTRSAIMADTKDHVKEYFTITKLAFRWFQKDWGQLYPVTEVVDNVNALKIKETGSSLLVCQNARGLTLDFLHIAEAAFIPDAEISDSIEAVPLSGWIILETTADTASGYFYYLWEKGEKGELASFTNHFFPWWERYPEDEDIDAIRQHKNFSLTDEERMLMDDHQLTKEAMIWRRLKISECNGDVGEFKRKYPEDAMTCFLSGSNGVFDPAIIQNLYRNERSPSWYGELSLG